MPSFPSPSAPSPRRCWSTAAQIFAEVARQFSPACAPPRSRSSATRTKPRCSPASSPPAPQRQRSFDEFARALAEQIPALKGVELVAEGRAENPKPVQSAAHRRAMGRASIAYRAAGFDYRVDHGAFFQVNRWLVDALVEQVMRRLSRRTRVGSLCGRRPLRAPAHGPLCTASLPLSRLPQPSPALEENLRGTTGSAVRASTLDFLRRSHKAERPDLDRR